MNNEVVKFLAFMVRDLLIVFQAVQSLPKQCLLGPLMLEFLQSLSS
jgi:hypothetical protein